MRNISIIGIVSVASVGLGQDTGAGKNLAPGAQPATRNVGLNLPEYKVMDPLFEAVRLAVAQRGEGYSADYIQGISGSAFRIAGICPCAPTCSNAMWPPGLIKLLGYDAQVLSMESAGVSWAKLEAFAKLIKADQLPDPATLSDVELVKLHQKAVEMIELVTREVAAGRPVLVWHAFTMAEFDVVVGYDSRTRQFLGRGSYRGAKGSYASAGEARTVTAATIGGWPMVVAIGKKDRDLDGKSAEIAAIKEAIRHAHDQKNLDKAVGQKWVMREGIAAYRRWSEDFESDSKKRSLGDAYCLGIYRSTHASAAGFLREIAPKYPKARASLEKAAEAFQKEAQILAGGESFLGWKSPEGPDVERNAAAAELLRSACEEYEAGIAHLEQALPLM